MLKRIADDVWSHERDLALTLGMKMPCRATILRLGDGQLLVHSPLAIDDAIAKEIAALGDVRFLVACFKESHRQYVEAYLRRHDAPYITAHVGRTPEVIDLAHACVAVSGSVGLELVYRGKPSVVVYRIDWLALQVTRRLMTSPYLSLVNLLAGEELFPEYLTDRCEAEAVSGHLLRRAVQVARAGVVTEPGPQVQHVIHGRIGQRHHVREALHEAPEVRDDGRHLRLLQHDLRHPGAIGAVAAARMPLPRQIVPAVLRVPVDEPCRDALPRLHDFAACAGGLRRPCSSSTSRSVTPFITMSS